MPAPALRPRPTSTAPALTTPDAPAAWSLGDTLTEIARRGASLRLASSGVKLTHAHRMPELARHVAHHGAALALWLRLGGDAGTRAVARGWDPEARLHAAWFIRAFDPPAGPLTLAPGHVVRDVARYRAAVADRLALGPDAPGAAALRATLAALFQRFGATDARPQPVPQRALAA